MTVVTDGSEAITKDAAIKALGDKAKRYVVVDWAEEGASQEVTYVAGMTGVT